MTDPLAPILSSLAELQISLNNATTHLEDAWKRHQDIKLQIASLREEMWEVETVEADEGSGSL